MQTLRRFVLALGFAISVVVLPASTAAAASTYPDNFTGFEIAATSTQGTFVGNTTGALPGPWEAVIVHTVLAPNATITGGSLQLDTALNGQPLKVAGTFNPGGTVTLLTTSTGCTNQRYALTDGLQILAGGNPGTGQFSGVLTHHRAVIFGSCRTYAATVAGSVSLIF